MKQGYLARESERVNKATRKALSRAILVLIFAVAVIYFLGRDSLNFNDISFGSVPFYIIVCVGIVLFSAVIKLIATSKAAANGKSLILPYGEDTQETVGNLIDKEAIDGKVLIDEYIGAFSDKNKAHGEKIVLTSSYLLLCAAKGGIYGTSKVTAIPRDKIYWVCAQVGRKGGPFIVQLLIFAENKIFSLTGTDVKHVQNIANMLYQYIPNVFSVYDPFELSYKLEEIFAKNPAEFLKIYENTKKRMQLIEGLKTKLTPFFLVEHEETISLCLYAGAFKSEVFQAKAKEGFEGSGHDWAALAKVFLNEKMPELKKEIQFDPEAGMFCSYSQNAEALQKFALAFREMCNHDKVMNELLSRAKIN